MAEQKIQLINAISFAKGTTEPSNREVWWIDDNITGNVYNKLKYFNVDSGSWELVQRTAAQLLLDLKTVDGAGSGLDADTLDGYTAAELLQGEIKLSSGEILVGQLNDQAAAKTLSGIATIDVNGALSYVANSISHTGLTDIGSNTHAQIDTHIADSTIHFTQASIDHTAIQNIGVNTHAQIDSHISSTANPHGVTAAQVGNTTAQWNANSIEGNLTNVGVLGAGQDGQALVWDNATSRFITAAVSSPSIYTSDDTIGSGRVATITDFLRFAGGRLDLSTTTDGFLMPRLTTAQMNAIAAPDTHLLIFNTDLNGIYRYNGSAWVALSAGYGIIEIIRDSDAGIPTFYADLQTALETCKTSGSNNVVKLHSDISLSAQIDIIYSGTGTGNGYQFESLTIDFNGFEVSFDDAGTTNAFNINLNSSSTSNQKLILLNGKISRTSGTGTHQALNMPATQYGTVRMSQMVIYCENSEAAEIAVSNGTGVNAQRNDFGGSVFISNASSGWATGFISGDNFKVISLGNASGLTVGSAGCRNVYIECKGSGVGASDGKLYDSYILTTTGDCVEGGGARIYNCQLFSTSGYIINDGSGTAEIYNSYGQTGNSSALYAVPIVDNCTIINNSSNDTVVFAGKHYNSTFINEGSGKVANINSNTRIFNNCILISEGGVPVTTAGACQGIFKNCTIKSNWNNAGGHAMSLGHTSNTVYVANCILEVANASANCLYAASAKNAAVGNCSFKGATTAINANVTLSLPGTTDAYGNIKIG